MHLATVEFYGGPFDGLVWLWSTSRTVDRRLAIAILHSPGECAIYGLGSRTSGASPRIRYAYEETVRPQEV
ncbi:hypothetical protein ACFW34_11970 [Streptomyces sp. NPDC058848]|uniref:hypothetical protein n=1 Tax=unclassified Streptomyces TaxID=2593676 RepID=UPI0036B59453